MYGKIDAELNMMEQQGVIDSILNVGYYASVVIDRSTFQILYQNERATELFGNKCDKLCYHVFCTMETPCMDCPMMRIGDTSLVSSRYWDEVDDYVKWQFSKIKWFDGRDAVLASLLFMEKEPDSNKKSIAKKIVKDYAEDRRETDSLTRIPNYSKFYLNVQNAIKYNPDKNYAVIVLDIDHFKTINDLYGMEQGDYVLKLVADSLKELFFEEENYGRLHSDKFAFFIPYKNKGHIIKTIEKIRKVIASKRLPFEISTSYGIYLVADRSVPANLMCDRAMMACRTIKDNILRFCAFYDEQYREDMIKASEIEKDMHGALLNQEFKMYLQPKFNLDSNTLCGAEVLCRWIHPTKGMIQPNDFIPLFEKNGFILKLDEYMWDQACSTLRRWIDEGRKPIPLSVNISRYHIHHNNLEEIFTKLLKKYDLSPEMLTLEITESLFLDNPEELNRVLIKLHKMGFKLEVDDFGAGFSSLNLIRNISVDTIKIDKEFLDNEIASEKGKIVVSHTISMAKALQLQVIAEGVETEEHVQFLKNSQCDIAQGFFFARPMPVHEFEALKF